MARVSDEFQPRTEACSCLDLSPPGFGPERFFEKLEDAKLAVTGILAQRASHRSLPSFGMGSPSISSSAATGRHRRRLGFLDLSQQLTAENGGFEVNSS